MQNFKNIYSERLVGLKQYSFELFRLKMVTRVLSTQSKCTVFKRLLSKYSKLLLPFSLKNLL